MIDKRILICAAVSVLGHYALGEALSTLPEREQPKRDRKIQVTVITPAPVEPPPPEPEKPPEPKPPEPPPKPEPKVVREKPVARPVTATVQDTTPKDVPIPDHAVVAPGATGTPVFGVTMESTSQGGTGPAVQVGNTTTPQSGPAPAEVKPQGAPVAAVEVTKMPLPQGRCSGKYTDAAREAGLEGVVVLDLVVDEKGRARDIKVVSGLEHGLTEAAITALKECQFSPGEKAGAPVAVRVRGFKIRFVMQDAQ